MARGGPHLSFFDEIDKLGYQKYRCNICDEDIRDEDGKTFQKISKLLNREKWEQFLTDSKANGNAYYLSYLKKRNKGGKNEPSNIQVVCPNCASLTKTVSVRLPNILIKRMDNVIKYENSNKKGGQIYGRSDFLADSIEAMVLLHEFNLKDMPKKLSASGHTIRIRSVKSVGGSHQGKWRLVILGAKVEGSGKKTKILYSNPDLAEAKQKVATWIGCSVEEVLIIEEEREISENNVDPDVVFELLEKIESDSKDINDIKFRLEEIGEKSMRMSEGVRNLMYALGVTRTD